MLIAIEDALLSKMIGLFNGLELEIDAELTTYLHKWLSALQKHEVKEEHLLEINELKKKYLANCLTCQNPCGRTADFSLNGLVNEALRNKRLNDYDSFIKTYNFDMSLKDILYNIVKLGW